MPATTNRRSFLKTSGLVLVPGFLPSFPAIAGDPNKKYFSADQPAVKFFYDGEFFDGAAYWEQLQEANNKQPIKVDRYGSGGAATLRIGQRKTLFDATPYLVSGFASWDISHDGKRFLMLRRTAQRSLTRMFVIENLPALLDRASATRR